MAIRSVDAERIPLSRRLKQLAAYVPPVSCLADIGTDHAWLLIDLIKTGRIKKGIGVEVRPGPYKQALANVALYGYGQVIDLRQGDGLRPLQPEEAQGAVIAGMGGATIKDILGGAPEVLQGLQFLVLQPMAQAALLRRDLQARGWRITQETLVEERDLIYQVLVAVPGPMAPLSWLEAEFGPLILQERSPLLAKEVIRRRTGLLRIATELQKSPSIAARAKERALVYQIKELEGLLS